MRGRDATFCYPAGSCRKRQILLELSFSPLPVELCFTCYRKENRKTMENVDRFCRKTPTEFVGYFLKVVGKVTISRQQSAGIKCVSQIEKWFRFVPSPALGSLHRSPLDQVAPGLLGRYPSRLAITQMKHQGILKPLPNRAMDCPSACDC